MSDGTTEGACDGTLDCGMLGTNDTDGDTEIGCEVIGMLRYDDGAKLKSADEETIVADDG